MRSEIQSNLFRKERLRVGMISGAVLTVLLFLDQWAGGVNVGRLISVLPLVEIAPIGIFIIGLSFASGLLAVERREGILPLLLITRLKGRDIVLGKMLQALVLSLQAALAVLPALIMPLIVTGIGWGQLWLILLGCGNVLFFALACGLLGAVFYDGHKAASLFVPLLLPSIVFSTPLGRLVPSGLVRDGLEALQWLNPCEALRHVQMAAVGVRPNAFWLRLLVTHAVAWGFLALAGFLLPHTCRWQSGVNAESRANKSWLWRIACPSRRSPGWSSRLLGRNPFHWLTSREIWPTASVWLLLAIVGAAWAWLGWIGRNVGTLIYYVLVLALGGIWFATFLTLVPAEASRRLVEDRQNGALEMLLCTPLSVREIVRGQRLSQRRRFLPPVLAVMILDAAFMIAGYALPSLRLTCRFRRIKSEPQTNIDGKKN